MLSYLAINGQASCLNFGIILALRMSQFFPKMLLAAH